MKKNLLLWIPCFLFLSFACQQQVDIEAEIDSIKTVIETETNAVFERDYQAHIKTLIKGEDLKLIASGNSWFSQGKGFEEIDVFFKRNYFESDPEPTGENVAYRNYEIEVNGSHAIAFYDQLIYSNDGEYKRKYVCVRGLEKIKGEWKINYLSWVNVTSYGMD